MMMIFKAEKLLKLVLFTSLSHKNSVILRWKISVVMIDVGITIS